MSTGNNLKPSKRSVDEDAVLSERLDGAGWALFFIWIGIATLFEVGWGWALLGIGIIVLLETAVRWLLKLNIGRFWIVFGLLFVVGGLWELFQVDLPLVPLLLILAGLAMLVGTVKGSHLLKK